MEFTQQIKDSIKNNMLHITTVMKKKPRNYLNKQLQDAVCNYFLENYAAPFLKEEYQIVSGRELRKKIEKSLPSQGKKYINLLNKFKSEIQRVQKGDEYRSMLSAMVSEEEKYVQETEEWCTLQRKKILALLLIVHWDEENILNFYDMWNSLYPTDPLIKQKLSKEEKEKQKKQAKNSALQNQTYIPIAAAESVNRMSFSTDSYSQESPLINSKRSSSSFIGQSNESSCTSNFVQQQQQQCSFVQNQPTCKKIINNRIFEEDNEEEQFDSIPVKIEYPQTKIRVCETVDINPRIYQQQQQQYQQIFNQPAANCFSYQNNYYSSPAQPIYATEYNNFNANNTFQAQNYQQIDQQNFKVECFSTESLENRSQRSESLPSFNNCENLLTASQVCSDDSYSSKNEYSDDLSQEENLELFNSNNAFPSSFVPNFSIFMNENVNIMENTLFSFLNF